MIYSVTPALLTLLTLKRVRAEGDVNFCKDAAQAKGDKEAFSLYVDAKGWWGYKEVHAYCTLPLRWSLSSRRDLFFFRLVDGHDL